MRQVFLIPIVALVIACSDSPAGHPDAQAADAVAPDVQVPDARLRDSKASDAQPDSGSPDVHPPDAQNSDSSPPDARTPDAKIPDGQTPDSAAPDTRVPDAGLPDSGAPDALAPDMTLPESECGDGLDNDGDNLTDCADPDCKWHPCRAPAGPCDAVEHCTNGVCPPDGFQFNTVCRAGGPCDIEERCTGTSADCPADVVAPSTTLCRAKTGPCDVEELCDGVTPDCPGDSVSAQGTICRASSDTCDPAELCDGASVTCPADRLAASGTVCRPKVGDCDVPESCDGASASCPADSFVAQGTLCRPSVGGCDSAESCSGATGTCPSDNTSCQSGYYCGGAACIPKLARGQACSSHAQCLTGHCYDGYCCNKRCGGVCRNCGLVGQQGTCVTYAEDTDPENECGAYQCYNTSSTPTCPTSCDSDSECKSTHYCVATTSFSGKCVPKLVNGAVCHADGRCLSGHCWRHPGGNNAGYCCSAACDSCCGDCSSGTCNNKPAFSQPNNSLCGRYTCDGQGGRFTSCVKDAFNCSGHCAEAYWCWDGKCEKDLAPGAPCLGSCQCKSNFCFFFACK